MENCIISIFFHYSCDAAPDSKSWPILDVVVAGSNNPVRFCIISHIKNENDDDKKEKFSRIEGGVVGSAGSQEIAANFQQKLLFDLKFWNGTALHFHYQPYRKITDFYILEIKCKNYVFFNVALFLTVKLKKRNHW